MLPFASGLKKITLIDAKKDDFRCKPNPQSIQVQFRDPSIFTTNRGSSGDALTPCLLRRRLLLPQPSVSSLQLMSRMPLQSTALQATARASACIRRTSHSIFQPLVLFLIPFISPFLCFSASLSLTRPPPQMRRRCPCPGAAQQALLVSAAVMALTLYYRAPAAAPRHTAPLHTAAPAARADPARPSAGTEAARAKAAAKKGGGAGVRAGWRDEAADFPISLERDTGEDSFASKMMMALEFLTKEKKRKAKAKATTPPPSDPDRMASTGSSMAPSNRSNKKETTQAEDSNPRPDPGANSTPIPDRSGSPAAEPAASRDPQTRATPSASRPSGQACRVSFPPLGLCECKREILAQGGAACPATNSGGETTPHALLAALNRTLGSSTCSDAATLRGANQSVR